MPSFDFGSLSIQFGRHFSKIRAILSKYGITTLFPPQAEALFETDVLRGKNLVLAIPTASGKTLIAELAMLKAILEKKGKVLYLTPLKALASEQVEEFRKFEELGIKVGISTGDYDSADQWLAHYDIIVTTNEKGDSLIRHNAPWLEEISTIIADEIHLLDDIERGPTLEVVLTRLRDLLPSTQILALSATIQNAEEVATWLDADLVRSDWRPVLLKEGVYYQGEVVLGNGERQGIPSRAADPVVNLCLDTVQRGGQVLIFATTRKNAVATTGRIAEYVSKSLTAVDRQALTDLAHQIRSTQNIRVITRLTELVRKGAAFHHAGLGSRERKFIETAFRHNLLKVVCATPTLAAGVNLPARRVVIAGYTRFSRGYRSHIRVLEYKQQAGRAGRPKYDKEGEAFLIARSEKERDFLMNKYVLSEPEKIQSRLASEPVLRTHALALIATGVAQNETELLDFFEKTFYGVQYEKETIHDKLHNVFDFLKHERFVKARKSHILATRLGLRTTQLYIDPLSAVRMRDGLLTMNSRDLTEIDPLGVLHVITTTTDMPSLYVGRDFNRIARFIDQNRHKFLVEVPDEYTAAFDFFVQEVKTAQFLEAWIEEVPEDRIIDRFSGIGPGDIQRLTETARWLLFSMNELARVLRIRAARRRLIKELELRVWYGCKRELLPLVKIPQIGRIRARALFRHGFTTIKHLQDADPNTLLKISGIGRELMEHIKHYVTGNMVLKQGTISQEREIPEPKRRKVSTQKTLGEFLKRD
ncbi:MAG: DEAD/DEAH box helicase [Candidatus Heimdallarchaeota archaeon]